MNDFDFKSNKSDDFDEIKKIGFTVDNIIHNVLVGISILVGFTIVIILLEHFTFVLTIILAILFSYIVGAIHQYIYKKWAKYNTELFTTKGTPHET